MLFTTGIAFYTSRVILRTLGIDDFGVYNLVGGIAVMFNFLNISLGASTVRYITAAIGENIPDKINEVFTISVKSHFFIGIAIVLLSEPLGLWLINNKLSIPL